VLPLFDEFAPRRWPIMTLGLIVACVAVFAWQQHLPGDATAGSRQAFECTWGMIPRVVVHGAPAASRGTAQALTCTSLNAAHDRYLTVVTSMFLHAGWWHLITNMLMLWVFGALIEDRLGRIRFLPFVLVCGVVAGLAQAYAQPSQTAVVIGASGAIAALVGAYLVLFPRNGIWTLVLFVLPMKIPAWVWAAIFVAIQLLDLGGGPSGVATFAHLAGVAVGAATITVAAHGRPAAPLELRRFRHRAAT
jgi:membrane associated rhomboid family serine protease